MRYAFTNFTNEPFEGRYGGVPYPFQAGETRDFDPDKHQMLIIMAKQLADKELLKNIHSVGKNPNDQERFGKSLDADGNIYTLTVADRKSLMRKAIGELVDVAVPVPADQMDESELGATVGDAETKKEISELKEMIAALTATVAKQGQPAVVPQVELPVASVPAPAPQTIQDLAKPEVQEAMARQAAKHDPVAEPSAEVTDPIPADTQNVAPVDMSISREILFDMAKEAGLNPTEDMTKESVLDLLNGKV